MLPDGAGEEVAAQEAALVGDPSDEGSTPVDSVKTAFKTAVWLAKLPGKITPHILRHTAATWLMQGGVSMWRAAAAQRKNLK